MINLIRLFALILFAISIYPSTSIDAEPVVPEVPSVKIWDAGEHNAFTGALRFKGRFYCTFRESDRHVHGKDGVIRVIASEDGEEWESVALLTKKGYDLRDSKISVTPDGRLMIVMGGSVYRMFNLMKMVPQVSFSDENGENFSDPEPAKMAKDIRSKFDWLWRVAWHGETGYGTLYQPRHQGDENALRLVVTVDGIKYRQVAKLDVEGKPGETTVRVSGDGEMFALVRREGGNKNGMWGRSKPPYTEWTWKDTGHRIGGPDFLELPDGRFAVGTRVYLGEDGETRRTSLFISDRDGNFTEKFRVPSSGDCSYPGMLIHENTLWFFYYSSHEEKTAIYLSRIPLDEVMK